MTSNIVVDARGSHCPGPLMELIAVIRDARAGDTIELLSADPGSRTDVPIWVHNARHSLIDVEDLEDCTRFTIRVEV
ncbi:MAG: preprotein translocase subunit TatB [Gammaproteobacteria bacterium]|nr:preprotein translocase subunit TatB [Gammaproteobacteria bacterium]